jgi:hypothetical protein
MYTFAYKYGRKTSYAPLFVHYTHSGASSACVNARATRGVDQIVDDDEVGAGGGGVSRGRGFVIEFGGVCYQDTYPIRILMYRDVSCVYPEGYMYP